MDGEKGAVFTLIRWTEIILLNKQANNNNFIKQVKIGDSAWVLTGSC